MKIFAYALCLATCALLVPGNIYGQQRVKRRPITKQQTRVTQSEQKKPTIPPMPVLPDIRNDPDVQAADVAIVANVTIEELRFDAVPNPTVEFFGKPKTATVWHTDRFNLPDEVQPGVTYRNVGIRLKITSRLIDIDRIVSEALGEIPISDDIQEKNKHRTPTTVVVPGDATNAKTATPSSATSLTIPTPRKRLPNE